MKMKGNILNYLIIEILLMGLFIPISGYSRSINNSKQKKREAVIKTRVERGVRSETYKIKTYRTIDYSVNTRKSYRKRVPDYTKSFKITSEQKFHKLEEVRYYKWDGYKIRETEEEKGRLERLFRDVKKVKSPIERDYGYKNYWRYYFCRRYYMGYRRYPYDLWYWDYPYRRVPSFSVYEEREEEYRPVRKSKVSVSLSYHYIDDSLSGIGAEFDYIRSRNMGFSLGWNTYKENLESEKNRLIQMNASFLYEFIPSLTGEIGFGVLYYEDESALGLKLGVRSKIPLTRYFNLWIKPDVTLFSDGILIGFNGGVSFNVASHINIFASYRSLISTTESLSGPSIGIKF